MYGCDICPGMKWSSFDEMLGHMHSVHGAYLDAKTSAAKYADLLQSHASLCGKIEKLKDELRKSNLQLSEIRKIAWLSVNQHHRMSDIVALCDGTVTEKPLCEVCGLGGEHKHPGAEKRMCERVVAVNTMGEVHCSRLKPCDLHG